MKRKQQLALASVLVFIFSVCLVKSLEAAPTIIEYPTGITGDFFNSYFITKGPDGNIWFTEYNNKIGRITQAGVVTEFSNGITPGDLAGITTGPDGNLWFAEYSGNRIGRINPTTGAVTEFPTGIPPIRQSNSSFPLGITTGADGNLWFTWHDGIGRITLTGVVTVFTAGISPQSGPSRITAGPDGNLWFTECSGQGIGRINPLTGVVTEFSNGITPGAYPLGITTGPDGNVWFTESEGDRIGRITPEGVITEFAITNGSRPDSITTGPDGNLWFTERYGDRIGMITPEGIVTEFSNGITPGSGPESITTGPDGTLWFTEFDGKKIGRVILLPEITEYSTGLGDSNPYFITSGPDGNIWFTATAPPAIGRITQAGVVTMFGASACNGITTGPDGNLWFADCGNKIGRLDPKTGTVTEFPLGPPPSGENSNYPIGITSGPDGNIWFTESIGNKIGRITPAGIVTEFSTGITAQSGPHSITAGPDGNLWFTEGFGQRIGRITPLGVVTEFSNGITPGSYPCGITSGPDGNLWFTENGGDRIGRITLEGVVTEFAVTNGSNPRHITSGPDGNLWFTEAYTDRIGRITPAGVVTEFTQGITVPCFPEGITAGPDGNLWFAEFWGHKIGRVLLSGPASPVIDKPDSSAVALSTATLGATIESDGGLTITGSGIAYGTSSAPDISGTKTGSPTIGGAFTVQMTGLSSNTLYHYRGYATNAAGTAYTEDEEFTTVSTPPIATAGSNFTPYGFTANWTAPPGTATISNYQLDVATDSGFSSFLPGYKDLTVPATSAAVTGLISGTYYYRVRAVNDGGTSTSSAPMKVVFIALPSISITSPNGANLTAGGKISIAWSYTGNPGAVRIDLLKGGSKVSTIVPRVAVGTNGAGSYSWTVPHAQASGSDYQIMVSSATVTSCTATSANLTITGPTISITSPNGGNWSAGGKYSITWSYTASPGPVRIDLLKGGSKVSTIVVSTVVGTNGTGSYSWTIPNTEASGSDYQIKVSSTTITYCTATSANFTIVPPTVSITSPSGDNWTSSGKFSIAWSYTGNPGAVRFDLLKGGSKVSTIVPSVAVGTNGAGSYSWIIPKLEASGSDYQIRVSSRIVSSCTATSANFTITGSAVSVTSPNGGTWNTGGKYPITWSYTGSPGAVRIDLLRGGSKISTIVASTIVGSNGTGSYSWTVPHTEVTGSDYTVEITSIANGLINGTSNPFTITGVAVSAGPDQKVSELAPVKLCGSNSTYSREGGAFYLWTQLDGPPVAIANRSSVETGFVVPEAGFAGKSLRFQLTITGPGGAESRDDCIINVAQDNAPPTADAGQNQTVAGTQIVVLDGSKSSASDAGVLSYSWRQVSGMPLTLYDPSLPQPTFVAPGVGAAGESLVFELTVTDQAGLRSRDTCIVNVVSVVTPPIARAGSNRTAPSGSSVILDGSGSVDQAVGIVVFSWRQIAGPPVTLSDPSAIKPSFAAPEIDALSEDLVFELTVTDSGGLQDKARVVITVASGATVQGTSSVLAGQGAK